MICNTAIKPLIVIALTLVLSSCAVCYSAYQCGGNRDAAYWADVSRRMKEMKP